LLVFAQDFRVQLGTRIARGHGTLTGYDRPHPLWAPATLGLADSSEARFVLDP